LDFRDSPDEAAFRERLRGWLSFYEGQDVQTEMRRIDTLNWRGEK